jgi:hypothetical protein
VDAGFPYFLATFRSGFLTTEALRTRSKRIFVKKDTLKLCELRVSAVKEARKINRGEPALSLSKGAEVTE